VADKVGTMAGIAILDVDAPEVHRDGWTTLAEVANNAAPKVVRQGRESSPRFTFKPKAEMLDGVAVDVLSVEVPGPKPEVDRAYRRLLGPDWKKVRMVVQGKQVVWLIGSDVEALKQTLRNLKSGDKRLAEQKTVAAALRRLDPERKLELHVNLKDYLGYLQSDAKDDGGAAPAEGLSSIALTVETDRVQLEIRVPNSDVRALVREMKLD
jgi:hypothetical protein